MLYWIRLYDRVLTFSGFVYLIHSRFLSPCLCLSLSAVFVSQPRSSLNGSRFTHVIPYIHLELSHHSRTIFFGFPLSNFVQHLYTPKQQACVLCCHSSCTSRSTVHTDRYKHSAHTYIIISNSSEPVQKILEHCWSCRHCPQTTPSQLQTLQSDITMTFDLYVPTNASSWGPPKDDDSEKNPMNQRWKGLVPIYAPYSPGQRLFR